MLPIYTQHVCWFVCVSAYMFIYANVFVCIYSCVIYVVYPIYIIIVIITLCSHVLDCLPLRCL